MGRAAVTPPTNHSRELVCEDEGHGPFERPVGEDCRVKERSQGRLALRIALGLLADTQPAQRAMDPVSSLE